MKYAGQNFYEQSHDNIHPMTICDDGYSAKTIHNKIRDLFKVKLYAIRSETKKKREREKKIEKKREREKKREIH